MTVNLADELQGLARWLDEHSEPITAEEVSRERKHARCSPASQAGERSFYSAPDHEQTARRRKHGVLAFGVAAAIVAAAILVSRNHNQTPVQISTPPVTEAVTPTVTHPVASSAPAGKTGLLYPRYMPTGATLVSAQLFGDTPSAATGSALTVGVPNGDHLEHIAQIEVVSYGFPEMTSGGGQTVTTGSVLGRPATAVWDAAFQMRLLRVALAGPVFHTLSVTATGDWASSAGASAVLQHLAEAVTVDPNGDIAVATTLPDGYSAIGNLIAFGSGFEASLNYHTPTVDPETGVLVISIGNPFALSDLAPLPTTLQRQTIRGGTEAFLGESTNRSTSQDGTRPHTAGPQVIHTLSWVEDRGIVITIQTDLSLAELFKVADALGTVTEEEWRAKAISDTPNHMLATSSASTVAPTTVG